MSSLSPDLHGDIKSGQNSFLLQPVSRADLANSKSSRNFWVYLSKDYAWSATGVSKDLKHSSKDQFILEAGLLWHKITRENKQLGLKCGITSFVPASDEPVEIQIVTLTNVSSGKIAFIPYAAIPIYARSAENLRDHRHVTSLLQRVEAQEYGVISKPTLSFDESGHHPNKNLYFVLGIDDRAQAPSIFILPRRCFSRRGFRSAGSGFKNLLPEKENIQGKEPMAGLRFSKVSLSPGKSKTYIILMGIAEKKKRLPGY